MKSYCIQDTLSSARASKGILHTRKAKGKKYYLFWANLHAQDRTSNITKFIGFVKYFSKWYKN